MAPARSGIPYLWPQRRRRDECRGWRPHRVRQVRRLRNIGRLFTGTSVGVIEDAAVICDGGKIAWCGPQGQEPHEMLEAVTDDDDCAGGLVTAGLIDAHTHPVYAGNRMAERKDLPRIEVTFLAAHALPPDKWARYGAYAGQVAEWCEEAHVAGARFCDVFCDRGYFSVPQSRRILKAGIEAKLIPRIHADELARTGGSRLAAELHAVSADHLLCANRSDAVALARAGVVATLAPATALSMGKLPPVKELAAAG